jgi:hypothetical protein
LLGRVLTTSLVGAKVCPDFFCDLYKIEMDDIFLDLGCPLVVLKDSYRKAALKKKDDLGGIKC